MSEAATGQEPLDLAPVVRAACGGDQEAFRVLYRQVQPGLLRYLRGLVGEDAEDVASETWLQIARDLRSFRDEGAGFRGWAAMIARNRAWDHLRRLKRRPAAAVPAEQLAELAELAGLAGGPDPADQVVQAAATNTAIALIATLPRDQAEAILLRVVVGLHAQTAARVLGKRPGAVRTAAWRGLRRLAKQLDAKQLDAKQLDAARRDKDTSGRGSAAAQPRPHADIKKPRSLAPDE